MTVRCKSFLVNKTNRCTEFQFYWCYYSTCLGAAFLPIIRSSEPYIGFGMSYVICSCGDCMLSGVGWQCTADVRLRTPDEGAERLPETCRVVIPIKLEFGASVGFIHKDGERSLQRQLFSILYTIDIIWRNFIKWHLLINQHYLENFHFSVTHIIQTFKYSL